MWIIKRLKYDKSLKTRTFSWRWLLVENFRVFFKLLSYFSLFIIQFNFLSDLDDNQKM